MTDTEAEKFIGCLVKISDRDYFAKGMVFFLYQSFREFTDTGEHRCGVVLRDMNTDSLYETTAEYIEVIDDVAYQDAKYKPFPSAMSIKEIYALAGKGVKYKGRCVRLRRICKESDMNRNWRYTLQVQNIKPPHRVIDVECYEISPWKGEQPEPVIKEEPPIVQKYKRKKNAEEAEKDRIKTIQEETLAALKAAADEPLHTVTAVDHNALAAVHITQFNNNCIGQKADEPLNTITCGAGHFGEVKAFLIKYYGGEGGQTITEPMHTVTTKDRFGLIQIQGEDYAIVDIGMRMLTPRELYNAQGFPVDYEIETDCDGKAYPKTKQVARCGNSVPPPFATALLRANAPEWCGKEIKTMKEFNRMIAV